MYAYIIPYNIINIKYKFYCVYYYYYPYYHVFHVTQETKLCIFTRNFTVIHIII